MPDCMDFILERAIELNASDVYLVPSAAPSLRVDGKLAPLDLSPAAITNDLWRERFLTGEQKKLLSERRAVDFSWQAHGRRWRGNMYYAAGKLAAVLRLVPEKIPTLTELGLAHLERFVGLAHGLLIISGYAGSGKTTTLAALVTLMAKHRPSHVITLEDPIEYIYAADGSVFSQRELGRDFSSFPAAIKNSLRQMPDVLLVGEIRDGETMLAALTAAEAGLLVLGTLHAPNAVDVPGRVEGLFPVDMRDTVRFQLAAVLAGIITERLIPSLSGGRVAATEVMLSTPAVKNMIRQGKYNQLESAMLSNENIGMLTLNTALRKLRQSGQISEEIRRKISEGERL